MRITITITSIAVVIGLLCIPLSGFASDLLNDSQIKEAFVDKTIQWQHLFKNKSGKTYYAADGTLTGIKNGSKREGTWHVSGNQVCVSWGRCLHIESDGDNIYYKIKNKNKKVVRIKILGNGNLL